MCFKIVEAKKSDREFIIDANKEIDIVSCIELSALKENVDEDLLKQHKAVCLIAKDGEKNIGMVLFSKVYWADRGEGVYVSQAYVVDEYRKKGVFKSLLQAVFEYYPDTNFITLLVAKDNIIMQTSVKKMNFELEDMQSYVINKSDF